MLPGYPEKDMTFASYLFRWFRYLFLEHSKTLDSAVGPQRVWRAWLVLVLLIWFQEECQGLVFAMWTESWEALIEVSKH